MHIQLWVKDFNSKLRADLFHHNPYGRQVARDKLKDYIEKIMTTSFGLDLVCRPHGCSGKNLSELTDASPQILRDARHNELSKNIKGEVRQL